MSNIFDEALKILKANAILFDDGTDYGASMLEAIIDLENYKKLLLQQEKKNELLDLYRLLNEFKERYNIEGKILDKQKTLDTIREITEEIHLKEIELAEKEKTNE